MTENEYPDWQERTDSLINGLAEAIDHEACLWTLKASSGEIIDHLMTLLETSERYIDGDADAFRIWSKEIGRCNGEAWTADTEQETLTAVMPAEQSDLETDGLSDYSPTAAETEQD